MSLPICRPDHRSDQSQAFRYTIHLPKHHHLMSQALDYRRPQSMLSCASSTTGSASASCTPSLATKILCRAPRRVLSTGRLLWSTRSVTSHGSAFTICATSPMIGGITSLAFALTAATALWELCSRTSGIGRNTWRGSAVDGLCHSFAQHYTSARILSVVSPTYTQITCNSLSVQVHDLRARRVPTAAGSRVGIHTARCAAQRVCGHKRNIWPLD